MRVCVCVLGGWGGVGVGVGVGGCVCVCVGGGGDNFGIRKALIGRIYTSFYVVPKRTIAYEAP